MRLYSGPLSMFGAKAQIAVAEKGIECVVELVPFGFRKGYDPKHPEVLRINPKGQVPVLVDGELEIFDSTQIFEYLEDRFPDPALWPADPQMRARARLLELKSDEVFFPNIIKPMGQRTSPDSSEAVAARDAASRFYDYAEDILAVNNFVAGSYSYADIALIMAHYFAVRLGADIEPRHRRFDRWRRDVSARSAVQHVLAPMSSFLRGKGLEAPAFAEIPTALASKDRNST
ncbi:glutathione S-transferase family protein [Bradyrhizobium sp. B120]|uniref:glutathione S-transferase family protein n=1 Tax=Bradyrhizobium sp. B120 TaxID=3410088 RepID=UPI003B97E7C9